MANSGGSVSANVVHLFRHLSEPEALRANPLVAEIFASAGGETPAERDAAAIAELRKRIERSADVCERLDAGTRHQTRGQRHRAIVIRCDLAGEPHEIVARDLGICIRHFYRERRVAQQRVAQLLAEQRRRPDVTIIDKHEAALAHAAVLAELGCSRESIGEFEAVAGASDGDAKIRALALLAGTLRVFGHTDKAWASLRAADRARLMRNGHGTGVERLWLRMSEAELFSECGAFEEAERAFAEAAMLLPETAAFGSTAADDVAVRASRALSFRAFKRGDSRDAVEYAANGLRILSRSSRPTLFVRETLLHAQVLSQHQLGAIDRDETRQRLFELLRFAQSAGSLEQSAELFCSLSTLVDHPAKESYRSQALELARRHGSTCLQRQVHLAVAAGMLVNGDPRKAALELNEAYKFGLGDVEQRIMALDIEARSSLVAGDPRAARTHSERAHRLASATGDQRARGAVMRTMAMVELQLGHLNDASNLIGEAIPVIAEHGSPSSLKLALRVRENIDRSARVARRTIGSPQAAVR